jgi:hypothetical protein
MIGDPAGVKRGHMVNRFPASQWHQRHDASHFDTKTQDKLVPELSKILLLRQNNPPGGARFLRLPTYHLDRTAGIIIPAIA